MTTVSLRTQAFVRRTLALAVLAVAIAAPAAGQLASTTAKLDPVLQGRARGSVGRSSVIVEFYGEPDARVVTSRGGTPTRTFRSQRALSAEIDDTRLADLARDPRVASVAADRPVFATMARTGAATGAAAARADLGVTGRGIGIASIDSGIAPHSDLPYIAHFKDFTRDSLSPPGTSDALVDGYGHGTYVAGVAAGTGRLSGGARAGAAPGAHVIGLRVLDDHGYGRVSDVIAAFDYAVQWRDVFNIRVITLAVGAGVYQSPERDPLALAAKRAVDAGIVVVAAAGNLGEDEAGATQFGGITSPANARWVLAVGASTHQGTIPRSDDAVASFSSRGPTRLEFVAKPDIVAPGVGIESLAVPQSTLSVEMADYLLDGAWPSAGGDRPYMSLSGTSTAAPIVAGTVALMLEANPDLTPNAVKGILQYTAQVLPGELVLAQGAGLVNARGAVRLARYFANPREGLGEMSDAIAGEAIPWSRHLIWGNYRVTGGVPLPGSNAWDLDVIWGDETTRDGYGVYWGAANIDDLAWSTSGRRNIVWSTTSGTNAVWGTYTRRNIVWSTGARRNIVWSTSLRRNIVWSTTLRRNIVWSTVFIENVVWGDACSGEDCAWDAVQASSLRRNIVWSTSLRRNIVWSTTLRRNIVWSTNLRRHGQSTETALLWAPAN